MWSTKQTTKCGATVVGMKNSNFGGEKLQEHILLELRGKNEMEARQWYLNTIPNMTRVKNLPVLKVGDTFKIDSSFSTKFGKLFPNKFPTGLGEKTIKKARYSVITDGYVF